MRLLILFLSAFLTAISAGGHAARAAGTAAVSAPAAEAASAKASVAVVPGSSRLATANDRRALLAGPVCEFAVFASIPLYASCLRL